MSRARSEAVAYRDSQPGNRSRGRARRGPFVLLARALALAVVVALSAAVGASAGSGSQPIQVEVTQCPGGSSQSSDCTSQSQSVGRQKQTQTITLQPATPEKAPKKTSSAEVHDFSLVTGKGNVSAGGQRKSEKLELDRGKSGTKPGQSAPVAAPAPSLPVVHTDGGG